MKSLLSIRGLHASVDNTPILRGVDLSLPPGELHAVMGPNGSGKSTLANVIMGHPAYTVTGGSLSFNGKSILDQTTDERARLGLFLTFQHPVSLPGIPLVNLIKKVSRGLLGDDAYPSMKTFFDELHRLRDLSGVPGTMLQRDTNEGFSGGERKKAEILQLGMVKPRLIILDEIDSGLDIDALKRVADVVNSLRNEKRSFLIITHYRRILSLVRPDRVHVMKEGRIARSGDSTLVEELEREGYGALEEAS